MGHRVRPTGSRSRLLRAALGAAEPRKAGASKLDVQPPGDLVMAATTHGVHGWVLNVGSAAGPALPALEVAVHGSLARYQRCLGDLHVVHAALTEAGTPFLVVKGPALVRQYYGDPRLRDSVDLDIVVRPKDLAVALEALERRGCELIDANWPLLMAAEVHELRVLGPSGGAIDLHWSLGPGAGSDAHAPAVETLLERSVTLEIAGVSVRTLDWADTVVHLAVHAASSGGHRLIWCADLRAALAQAPAGATALLVARAEEWRARPALHLMLLRAQHALGMPLSEDLLAELSPGRAWSTLVWLTERLAPVARARGGPSATRIVARSARQDARGSWLALASKAGHVIKDMRGGNRTTPADLRDATNPRSGLFPQGGTEGRKAFLSSVVGPSIDPDR